MQHTSLAAVALALLAITPSYPDTLDNIRDEIKFNDLFNAELEKRKKVSGPKKSRLKITAKDGTVHYVDATEGPTEYLTIDDIASAKEIAEKKVKDDKQRGEREGRQYLIENQPQLKAHAEQVLSRLNFDVKRNIFIDRRLAGQAENINLEVAHFCWQPLQRCCQKKDWLNALNIIYNIVHGNSEIEVQFDLFPHESDVEELYSKLSRYEFSIKWAIPKDIDIVAFGRNILYAVSSLAGDRPHIERGANGMIIMGCVSENDAPEKLSHLPILSDSKIYLGFRDGQKYGPSILALDKPSFDAVTQSQTFHMGFAGSDESDADYVIPGIVSITKERYSLVNDVCTRRITRDDYQKMDDKLRDKYKAAFEKTFVRLCDSKSEVQRVKAERQRRYPSEQKEWAAYAEKTLSKLNFDVEAYFRMQKDLRKYIYSLEVSDKLWSELKKLQREKNWLGMLNAIGGMQDTDYPSKRNIDALVGRLRNKDFHLAIKFTHDHLRIVTRKGFEGKAITYYENDVAKELIVTFCLMDSGDNRCIIYNPCAKGNYNHGGYSDGWSYWRRKSDESIKKVEEDLRLGRITEAERTDVIRRIREEFNPHIAAWLDTAIIDNERMGMRPIAGRKKPLKSKVASSNNAVGSKPKFEVCPDCEGAKYISKGKCKECNGQGWYLTPVTRGIGGRAMGGRKRQCPKCNGKGEIKELCKGCRGRGKIKQ